VSEAARAAAAQCERNQGSLRPEWLDRRFARRAGAVVFRWRKRALGNGARRGEDDEDLAQHDREL